MKSRAAEPVMILGAFAAAIAAIQPRGNFPLNDDWDFATAAWAYARTGHFHFSTATAVSLRAQVLWGALWTRLFGESFEVLRASTLFLAAATLLIVYATLRRAGAGPFARVAGTLALAFHPVFLWASCSFHTEVPFVFASAIAFYCFLRGIDEERLSWLLAGCAATILSWFVRQTGVATLLAPLALVLWRRRPSWKRDAAILAATIALFVVLLIVRPEWLAGAPAEFAHHFAMWTESSFRTPQQLEVLYHYLTFHAQATGLFFLPLVVAALFSVRSRWAAAGAIAIALFFLPRVYDLVSSGHPMPYFARPYCCDILNGNILTDWGLGQQTMHDIWGMGLPYPWHLAWSARVALTYGALLAAAMLLFVLFRALGDARVAPRLTALGAMAAFCALLGSGVFVDRYSLDAGWMVAITLALMIPWERRGARVAAATLLVVVALFDVLSLQEYFAWHRARWAAYHELRATGVGVKQIEPGEEITNFYESRFLSRKERRLLIMYSAPREYVLAFRALPGYRVLARHPFTGWLGWHRGAIYTLQRPAPV